jgi:hypothetical protein
VEPLKIQITLAVYYNHQENDYSLTARFWHSRKFLTSKRFSFSSGVNFLSLSSRCRGYHSSRYLGWLPGQHSGMAPWPGHGVAGSKLFRLLVALTLLTATTSGWSMADHNTLMSIRVMLSEVWLVVFPSWTGTNCCIDWYGMVHNPTMGCIANLSLHDVADDVVMGSAGWHASRVLCVPRRSHYTNGLGTYRFSNKQERIQIQCHRGQ